MNIKLNISLVFIFSVLLLNISSNTIAQENDGQVSVYVEPVMERGSMIKLKWIYEDLDVVGGWDVYRRGVNQSSWQKINEAPVQYGGQSFLAEIKADKELSQYIELLPEEGAEFKSTYAMFMLKLIIEHDVVAQYFGLRYNDSEVEVGKSYEYKVQAVLQSEVSGTSPKVNCCDEDRVSVKDFKVFSQNKDAVTLKWIPEPDAYFGVNCYRINRNTNETSKLNEHPILVFKYPDENNIFRYPDYFFKDTLIADDGHYTYYAKPISVFGNEGKRSDEASVNIDHHIPPSLPEAIDYLIDDKKVMITWNNNSPTYENIKVIVERSSHSKKGFKKVGKVNIDSGKFIEEVEFYNWYYYRIYAQKNRTINSPIKQLQCYVTDKIDPTTPENLVITTSGSDVTANWNRSKEDGLIGYRVFLSLKVNPDIDDFSPLMDSVIEETEFTFTLDSTMESDFLVAVAAYDSFHNKSEYLISEPLIYHDVIVPESPTLIKVTRDGDNLFIDWLESQHVDVVTYNLYQRTGGNMQFELVKSIDAFNDPSETSIPILKMGEDIEYGITAVDDADLESELSNVYTINIQEDQQFVDELDNGTLKLSYSKYEQAVKLNWKNNDIENYKGYVVFRSENDKDFTPVSGLIKNSKYLDTDINNSATYSYYIRYYTVDNDSGKYDTVEITIPPK